MCEYAEQHSLIEFMKNTSIDEIKTTTLLPVSLMILSGLDDVSDVSIINNPDDTILSEIGCELSIEEIKSICEVLDTQQVISLIEDNVIKMAIKFLNKIKKFKIYLLTESITTIAEVPKKGSKPISPRVILKMRISH